MSGYDNLNRHEKKYVRTHPINSYRIRECKKDAVSETERLFGYNGRNDQSDAFRHCYWSALIAKRVSYYDAIKFTTLHEMRPGNDLAEKRMDLHNNKIGAQIGRRGGSAKVISDKCYKALKQGKLTYLFERKQI